MAFKTVVAIRKSRYVGFAGVGIPDLRIAASCFSSVTGSASTCRIPSRNVAVLRSFALRDRASFAFFCASRPVSELNGINPSPRAITPPP